MVEHLVSVVIPVYNGRQYIAAALQSVRAQSYSPVEIIVVDDGSTDGSAELLHTYCDIVYVRQDNSGTAAARNRGVQEARGEFIAFLDQDDCWTANKLAVQIEFMRCYPDLGYTVASERLVVEGNGPLPAWLKPELVQRDHVAWLPSTLVARREIFDKVGLFDTTYSASSDSDWFFRANDLGVPMAALSHVLLEKRVHTNNQSYDSRLTSDLLRQVRASLKRKAESKEQNNGQ